MSRPTYDELYIGMAVSMSQRGTCNRGNVGAIVAQDNRLLLGDYNGAPEGEPHCTSVGCLLVYEYPEQPLLKQLPSPHMKPEYVHCEPPTPHCLRSIHAEQNVIGLAARLGVSLKDATWYIWPWGPCLRCELLLLATQPKRVVFPRNSSMSGSLGDLLRQNGVSITIL